MDINEMKKQILEVASIDELKRNGAMPPLPRIKENSNYVFISYPHADYKCVYCDLLELYKHGVKYWYDRGLTPGKNWEEEVASKIQDPLCSGIVYYLSENSFTPSMLFEMNCSKSEQGKNIKTKNYFSVNISGRNTMELLFAIDYKSLKLTQEGVAEIFNTFSSAITYIKRSENPFESAHILEIIHALEERFNIICKENNGDKKARELLEKAEQLTKQGKIVEALAIYQEVCGISSASNDTLSQANMQIADYYTRDTENTSQQEIIIDHIRSAAELGNAEGLYRYAQYYDKISEYEKGAQYYLKAAEAGHSEAQYQIAGYYCTGSWDIPQNVQLAIMWYKKAADQGHKRAKEEYDKLEKQSQILVSEDHMLSAEELYQKAKYYDKISEYEKGAQYYLKAAEVGHPEAQYQIAGYYCTGSWDIPQNVQLAIMWYKKAADQGHKRAKEKYEKLKSISSTS